VAKSIRVATDLEIHTMAIMTLFITELKYIVVAHF